MRRDGEQGVVLVYVLVLLALTSSVVVAMVSLSENSIRRSQRFSEAGQAQALIAAGEASALIALRRDMAEAPKVDHAGEPWGRIGQQAVAIEGGSFSLEIADAQGLYNLNGVAKGGVLAQQRLRALVAAVGLPPDVAARLIATLAAGRDLARFSDLAERTGMTGAQTATLAGVATVLPGQSEVNINSAPVAVLAALLNNPGQARLLVARRTRNGFLSPLDVTGADVILPPGLGFRSEFFRLRVTVRIGDTVQATDALIQRQIGADGSPAPVVIGRNNVLAAPLPLPPA